MEKKNQSKSIVAIAADGVGTNSVRIGSTTPRNNTFSGRKDSRSKNINYFNKNNNETPFYKIKSFSSNKITTPYNSNTNRDLNYDVDKTSYNKNNNFYSYNSNTPFRSNNNYFRSKKYNNFNNNNNNSENGYKNISGSNDKNENFEEFSKFNEENQEMNNTTNNNNKNNNNKKNKKFTQSLNHMINFQFTKQVNNNREASNNHRYNKINNQRKSNRNYGKGNRNKTFYNKETFLQANCKFVMLDGRENLDGSIEWSSVLQVILHTHEDISCPICLHPPVASQVTKCGHTYCFPCILHYLSLSSKSWSKCPICSESIMVSDLKSVKVEKVIGVRVGDEVVMRLMMRRKGSNLVTYADEGSDDGVAGDDHDGGEKIKDDGNDNGKDGDYGGDDNGKDVDYGGDGNSKSGDCCSGRKSINNNDDDDGSGLVSDLTNITISDNNNDDITTDTTTTTTATTTTTTTTGNDKQEELSTETKIPPKHITKTEVNVINSNKEATGAKNKHTLDFDESSSVLVTDTKRSSHNKILLTTHNYTRECLQLQREQLHVLMAFAEPLEEPFIQMALQEVEKREELYDINKEENTQDNNKNNNIIMNNINNNEAINRSEAINRNDEIVCRPLDTKENEAVVYTSAFDEQVDDGGDVNDKVNNGDCDNKDDNDNNSKNNVDYSSNSNNNGNDNYNSNNNNNNNDDNITNNNTSDNSSNSNSIRSSISSSSSSNEDGNKATTTPPFPHPLNYGPPHLSTTPRVFHNNKNNNAGVHYFYQAIDGQHTYLDSLNVRCLKHQYGHLSLCPSTIKGKVLDIEEKSMNESLRDRNRYLEHVSLSSTIQFVHLNILPPYLSDETLNKFKGEFDARKKMRRKRRRMEGQRCKRIDEHEKKMMGMVTWGTIIKSDFRPNDVIIPDDDPVLGACVPDDEVKAVSPTSTSFAQMLKQGKQQAQHNITWPKPPTTTPNNPPPPPSSSSWKKEDEEDEDDDGVVVPDFKESWLQGCSVLKVSEEAAGGPSNKGKKKNKKKVVLFSTGSFARV